MLVMYVTRITSIRKTGSFSQWCRGKEIVKIITQDVTLHQYKESYVEPMISGSRL